MADKFINQKFGKLFVIERTNIKLNKYTVYECQCECGNTCFKTTKYLRNKILHCGCLTKTEQIRNSSIVKLSVNVVKQLKQELLQTTLTKKEFARQMAKKLKMSISSIENIIFNKCWKDII